MKKLFALLIAVMIVFSIAACGNNDTSDNDTPDIIQNVENLDGEENSDNEENQSVEANHGNSESSQTDESVPTTGTPLDWPDNDYTKLVPTPNVGGKVLSSGEIGTLFSVELKWSMDQGIAYAQQLQEAGFGDDCVEKYEKNGYIDRTENGINVQLMDLFGVTSLAIMKVE